MEVFVGAAAEVEDALPGGAAVPPDPSGDGDVLINVGREGAEVGGVGGAVEAQRLACDAGNVGGGAGDGGGRAALGIGGRAVESVAGLEGEGGDVDGERGVGGGAGLVGGADDEAVRAGVRRGRRAGERAVSGDGEPLGAAHLGERERGAAIHVARAVGEGAGVDHVLGDGGFGEGVGAPDRGVVGV